MYLKSGILVLCFLAEIGLGVYAYYNSESLFIRFLFFIFTAVLAAVTVISFFNSDSSKDTKDISPEASKREKEKR